MNERDDDQRYEYVNGFIIAMSRMRGGGRHRGGHEWF